MQALPMPKIFTPEAEEKKTDFQEWDPKKRWNPFNSNKLLSHVGRWKEIKRGRPVPPPVLVTIDPTNVCNFNCVWCNAEYIRKRRRRSLSEKALHNLAEFLVKWEYKNGVGRFGVEAACVAGGGEPLLNPATAGLIDHLTQGGIQVGLVSNGSRIHDFVDSLSQCTWVGVSVDAGAAETFNRLKGLPRDSDLFNKIIENIAVLADYSRRHFTTLGKVHPAYGVSFKYLIYNKENIGEIYEATRLAKEIGCKNIHFRPAGTTWDKIGTDEEIRFSKEDIQLFQDQITRAAELDDDKFGVYGITHKFNSQFDSANYFRKCYAIFMTAVFMPPENEKQDQDSFTMGLCCDRRGAEKLELVRNSVDFNEISKKWGGKEHWDIHDKIMVAQECPRCTYQPHNEIYEQVILNDAMTYKFI
ncbi:MAG: radical SAM protein [Pseudomonadota bacterium]